jgi:hypothetical protein
MNKFEQSSVEEEKNEELKEVDEGTDLIEEGSVEEKKEEQDSRWTPEQEKCIEDHKKRKEEVNQRFNEAQRERIDIPEQNRKKGPMADIENKVLTKEGFERILDYWRVDTVGRLNAIYFDLEPVVKEEHILEQYRSFKELYQSMGGGQMSHDILQHRSEDSQKLEAVAREIIQEAKSEVIREWERDFKLAETEEEKKEIRKKIDKILFQ